MEQLIIDVIKRLFTSRSLVFLFFNTITEPTTSLPAGSRCRPKQLSQRSTFDTAGGDSDGGKSLWCAGN